MFAYLPTDDKTKRILHLWNRCYTKLNAALLIKHALEDVRLRIRVEGVMNFNRSERDHLDDDLK